MSQFPQHKARKRFGQNFLHDAGVIDRIIRSIRPRETDHLVEIGPGQGAITSGLLASGARLDVVELDKDLHPILMGQFGFLDRFRLHKGDALKFNFRELAADGEKLRVVGNLPYNISTPLMFHLLDQVDAIEDMCFMLQKEVVDRLVASPGTPDWGRLSVMIQYYCRNDYLFFVPPTAFSPPPKVDSAVVRLTPYRELPHPADDIDMLRRIVAQAFTQRRKVIRNGLKSFLTSEQISAAGVDPGLRPDSIDLAGFVALANQASRLSSSAQSDNQDAG